MSAIEVLESACTKDLETCEETCQNLKEFLNDARPDPKAMQKCVAEAEANLAKVKKSRKNISLELTQIKDRTERNQHAAIAKDFDTRIQEITGVVQMGKMRQNKAELMSEARSNPYSTEGKTNDELLDATHKVIDKTFDSLGRTKMMIEQSKDVATATIEELQRQRVQMKDIENDIDTLETNLQRAEKLVITFSRRMATDKIIQAFMVLNICIVISIAVYAGVTKSSLSGNGGGGPGNLFGSSRPTAFPTIVPTFLPTESFMPTVLPTFAPTPNPTTFVPSRMPSIKPTVSPTVFPSVSPSVPPTIQPTVMPTVLPPTITPSVFPTASPSESPTLNPSANPTANPTANPVANPTASPVADPTANPIANPTTNPIASPTPAPT